jgi:hypothetical protein
MATLPNPPVANYLCINFIFRMKRSLDIGSGSASVVHYYETLTKRRWQVVLFPHPIGLGIFPQSLLKPPRDPARTDAQDRSHETHRSFIRAPGGTAELSNVYRWPGPTISAGISLGELSIRACFNGIHDLLLISFGIIFLNSNSSQREKSSIITIARLATHRQRYTPKDITLPRVP